MSQSDDTVAAWKRRTRSALSSITSPRWRPGSCVAMPVGHSPVWHLSDWTQPRLNMKARAAFDQSAPSAQLTASPAPEWTLPEAARRISSRSEEHTSELQSLMRISYAVFCLKKKKNNQN